MACAGLSVRIDAMDLKDILGVIKSNSRNVAHFRSGRQFAAWFGLTPRANSSGSKDRLTGITKLSDGYLRRLLVAGATTVLRHASKAPGKKWAMRLLERRRPKVVAVALANKTARIA
jgi:transposase